MKSVEVKFQEALEQLKKTAASKYDRVFAECQKLSGIEAKLNCVEAALKGTVKESANNIDEALRDPAVAILFGNDPKTTTTNKESKPPIKKNNGTAENFVEGSPFNGDRSKAATSNAHKDTLAKGDKVLADGLLKVGGITEAEYRKLTGSKPEGYDRLSEKQRKEFDFARAVGISEADAFTLAKMTGSTLKEVSR